MKPKVRLLLSDVDGTLVTPSKVLTPSAIRAVESLHDAGIIFAITSARPPQGLSMFIEPLSLTTPIAAFNGGLLVDTNLNVLQERKISGDLAGPIIDLLQDHEMSVWAFQGTDWYVLDEHGPYVAEESRVCDCEPTTVANFHAVADGATKVVGISDDPSVNSIASSDLHKEFSGFISATNSQPYYLDVTHPDANKGNVVKFLAQRYDISPHEIATIGDMHNDVSMFAASGLSIAMGNAEPSVQQSAIRITRSNREEGFAHAVNEIVLKS